MKKIKKKFTSKDLSIDKIYKVSKLFKMHQWEIDGNEDNEFSLYHRFCETLNLFEEEQQELIIDLTKKFLKIDLDGYLGTLKQVLKNMYNNDPSIFTSKIFILPLNFAEENYKVKSSAMMAYLFQNSSFNYEPYFAGKKITIVTSIQNIPNNINTSASSIIFLVDDYIGTGDTAETALNSITDSKIIKDKIIVVSLVAQNEGVKKIEDMGFKVYAAHYRKKGISEEYEGEKMEKYTNLMEEIERKILPRSENKFGYKRSEALVSMIRTPNNTFPIYWFEGKGSMKMNPPFPRS